MGSLFLRRCSFRTSFHAEKLFDFGALEGRSASFASAAAGAERVSKNATKKKKEKARKEKKKAARSEESGEGASVRFESLIGKCLDAPSPVRHVKLKERLREKEMEKYGLMTKDRQREVEQEKAREKAKKKGTAEEDDVKPTQTAEEGKRLAKEYSRILMREERKRAAGETVRLRLKLEAIEALPPHLKEAAMVPDYTPFPGLCPATLTPPIPGFVYEYEKPKEEQHQ